LGTQWAAAIAEKAYRLATLETARDSPVMPPVGLPEGSPVARRSEHEREKRISQLGDDKDGEVPAHDASKGRSQVVAPFGVDSMNVRKLSKGRHAAR
jgi:hypothetical protein